MRVFLSYNNRDRATAERLLAALQRRRPDLEIYFAPRANTAGAYWIARLGAELAAADAMLLLLGERVGRWQEPEYYDALKRNRAGGGHPRILPVLLADTLPGLPFLDQFHRLVFDRQPLEELVEQLAAALEGVDGKDTEPLWRRVNPYRGLAAADSANAAYFFGREALTGEVLETLRRQGDQVLTLVGNSGVGKSSVAQAGVLAALRSRLWPGDVGRAWPAGLEDSPSWLTVTIVPGERPLKALAQGFARTWLDDPADVEQQARKWVELFQSGSDLSALADAARAKVAEAAEAEAPAKVLLYVDQGEELYARAEASEARRFSELLAEAVRRPEIAVLASLRADYYGYLQADRALFAASARVDVPPLGEDELRRVIEEPAARLGVSFETRDLVGMIARSAAREPGALPMLSFLMADAWERMRADDESRGVLRFPFEVVDVAKPLAERAERFLDLHRDQEATLRRLFTLRLAHVPAEGEPVRRRALKAECSAREWALAQELAGPQWRLLSTTGAGGAPAVEVAHEALLRGWPRLARWLEDEREFLVWKGQLEARRREWEAAPAERQDDALLMGLPLDIARQWHDARSSDLPEADRNFIEKSAARAEAEAHEAAAMAQREARQRTWIARLSVGAAVIFAVFASVAGWQWYEVKQAETRAAQQGDRVELLLRQTQIEQARFRADKAQELTTSGDATAAMGLALTAMPQANPDGWPSFNQISEVLPALYQASLSRRDTALLHGHEAAVYSSVVSPNGARLVTASTDATARIWDIETAAEVAVLSGHKDVVFSASFSPDGKRIVTASDDDTARIWDAQTGTQIAVLSRHQDGVRSASFSPDGKRIVTASDDGTARIWDAKTGAEVAILRGHQEAVLSANFSPDGARIVTASEDSTVRIWHSNTGLESQVLRWGEVRVYYATFSPDGARVIAVSMALEARIWDASSGHETAVLTGHDGLISTAAFSPDSTRVVTASGDRTARIWDADSGAELAVLREHEDSVRSAAFSPDGTRVVTASSDGSARIWRADNGAAVAVLRGHEQEVTSALFSPDGTRLFTTSKDATVRIWDARSSAEVTVLQGHSGPAVFVKFSPGGKRVVTSSEDATARIWNAESGDQAAVLQGHEGRVVSADFSLDGARVITASWDGTARIWDAETGSEIVVLSGHDTWVLAAAFSDDGKSVVTASADGTARIWNSATGAEIAVLGRPERNVESVAITPDGSRVSIAYWGRGSRIWHVQTGAEFAITDRDQGENHYVRALSHQPARVLTTSLSHAARVWDTDTGTGISMLRGHQYPITYAEFSPDGTRVVTASRDLTARIWDAETGTELAVLRGHEDTIKSTAFSPNGTRIITASEDATSRIWDAETGTELAVLRGHKDEVWSAAFSPDGAHVVTSSYDATARIWPHFRTADELYEHARKTVERLQPLSDQEKCDFYLKIEGCGADR